MQSAVCVFHQASLSNAVQPNPIRSDPIQNGLTVDRLTFMRDVFFRFHFFSFFLFFLESATLKYETFIHIPSPSAPPQKISATYQQWPKAPFSTGN